MQKVLIISYFFPPSNFVGGERTKYWANNLHKYNFYPIIITRCRSHNQKEIIGPVNKNFNKHHKNKNSEVHYLKYRYNLRDHLHRIKYLRKLLTVLQQISFYLIPSFSYYNDFYLKSSEVLKKNKNIKSVIVSGRPFELFYVGYKLKKKFPHIKWIPDYRDQWNTYRDRKSKSKISKVFGIIEKRLEKKWTSNCSFFITTSPNWLKNIEEFINNNGVFIANGYDGKLEEIKNSRGNRNLKILYAGTLYQNQKIEMFCKAISEVNIQHNNKIEMEFIGCEMIEGQVDRLKNIKKDHTGVFTITNRVEKKKLHNIMLSSDLFYLSNFNNVSGWYPVKLFEYAKYNSPILMYPSDNGLIKEFITNTNTGFVLENFNEIKTKLIELLELKLKNKKIVTYKNQKELFKFSREYQTQLLSKVLKS